MTSTDRPEPVPRTSDGARLAEREWYVDDREHPLRHRRVCVHGHEVELVEDDTGIVALDEVKGRKPRAS